MKNNDFDKVSAQLANPTGEEGILTAQRMNQSNGDMTKKAVDLLECGPGQSVLEIGPGNGRFAEYVLEKAPGIRYEGTDLSADMISEALRINQPLIDAGLAVGFHKTDGLDLPYEDHVFHRVFTVNSIYFWEEPDRMVGEVRRVLKTGGVCCLAFASREFMESLPFTDGRFTLYDQWDVERLLMKNGFRITGAYSRLHETTSAAKMSLMREEIFVCGTPN